MSSAPRPPPPLTAMLEQAKMLHGPARPEVRAGRDGIFGPRQTLPIPGWLIGLWDFEGGLPTRFTLEPSGSFRALWLAETGHLVWVMVDAGVFSDESSLVVSDTPGDFHRHVCSCSDVGAKVWTDALLRLPILSHYEGSPLEGWRKGAPPGLAGGAALLSDPPTRELNGKLVKQNLSIHGEAQSLLNWSSEDGDYEIYGWPVATLTEGEPQAGESAGPRLNNMFILTEAGGWILFSRSDTGASFHFYDSVGDFYRHLIQRQPEGHPFRELWQKLTLRFSLLRKLDKPFQARWQAPR